MQVKNYVVKNSLELTDVLDALKTSFNRSVWSASSQLKDSHIELLNQTFGVSSKLLPPAKEVQQLPQASDLSNKSQISNLPSSDLARILIEQNAELALPEVMQLKTSMKTKLIVENAQLAAISDHQTYQDIYEDTAKTLMVNETVSWLEQQKANREQFKSNQMVREIQKQRPNSKDLTSQLLDSLEQDNAEFINQFLK